VISSSHVATVRSASSGARALLVPAVNPLAPPSMEFVEGAAPPLISRYDPHPTVFKPKSPTTYNPIGGAKFMPKLAPSTIGNPTMSMVSSPEKAAAQMWHKGGWEVAANPFEFDARSRRGAGPAYVPTDPLVMRGGWPAGGAYSSGSKTGDFGWYTGDAPPEPAPPKTQPTYSWQHKQFLRATA